MKTIRHFWLCVNLSLIAFSLQAQASQAKLASVDLRDDHVMFALQSPKTHAIPSCAANATGTKEMWTFSINDAQGRAMYSMLMTAVAKQQAVKVTSGQTCFQQVELASGLSLVVSESTEPAGGTGNHLYLYKGDGVTKLGVFAGVHGTAIQYLPLSGHAVVRYYRPEEVNGYYDNPQCHGNKYVFFTVPASKLLVDTFYGVYMKRTDTKMPQYPEKDVYHVVNSECVSANMKSSFSSMQNYRKTEPAEHPLCGLNSCIVK